MWSCKCDMVVMSCCTKGSSFSVWRLVNPLQPLICLVTLSFASSLSIISLIIVSHDVMKIIIVENVTLILLFCICVPHLSLFFSPVPLFVVCFMRCMHISQLSFVFAGSFWQHLVSLWLMSLPCPPFLQYAIYESAGGKSPGHACDSIRTPPWTKA